MNATQSTSRLIKTGTSTIEVFSIGSGPTVVLLPSLGRGAADFAELAPSLAAKGYRVLRPEPRGIGRSTGPMTGNTLHDLAADIAAVILEENAAPSVVAGHAFGNKVARTLAADRPDLVRAVIILAGAGRAAIPEDVRIAIHASGDLARSDEERLGHLRKAFFAPGSDPRVWLGGWHPATKAMEYDAERATPPDDFITAGRAPILDLQAADDTVVPPENRLDLKNEVGDRVTIAVVARAGHALLPEQPQAVADAIHRYIASLPA
jgi:pimeloyl-ACP methyl ester carboxylesterase